MPENPPFEFIPRAPRAELTGIARRLWFLRGPSPQPREKILPMPFVHLIVNLGEPYRILAQGGTDVLQRVDGAFVSGIQSTWLLNENPAELHHVGVELAPTGLRALGAPAIGSVVVDAVDLLPSLVSLRQQLGGLGPSDALDRFEAALVDAVDAGWQTPPAVAAALPILDSEPTVRIADVARRVGTSPKHLAALFRATVGLSPKRYADVVRHYLFLQAVPDTPPYPRWSDLVAGAGYYDQPHFIRTFARFTGMTPQHYLASKQQSGEAHFLPG